MAEDFFKELSQLMLSDADISEHRHDLNELVQFFKNREPYENDLYLMTCVRKGMPIEAFRDADAFFVPEDFNTKELPEKFMEEAYDFCRSGYTKWHGRVMLPVKDVKGDVMGFTGWDPTVKPKYLDSENYGYVAKRSTLLGMENLPKYYSDGYVVIVEGPMCMLWLRSHGVNCMSSLGSHLTSYVVQILKRFGSKCLVIADADEAGDKFKKQVRRELPDAICKQCLIANDIDDARKIKEDIHLDVLSIFENEFNAMEYFY